MRDVADALARAKGKQIAVEDPVQRNAQST